MQYRLSAGIVSRNKSSGPSSKLNLSTIMASPAREFAFDFLRYRRGDTLCLRGREIVPAQPFLDRRPARCDEFREILLLDLTSDLAEGGGRLFDPVDLLRVRFHLALTGKSLKRTRRFLPSDADHL